jgi:hypothetical protein
MDIAQQQGYSTTTGVNHISANQSYVTRLFLSTLALVLITLVPISWSKLAILPASPLGSVTLRDIGIW